MDFFDLIRFYRKYGLIIISFSFLSTLAAAFLATKIKPSFEATVSVFIRREASVPSPDFYNYDGYYSQQAAERFADTVIGVFRSKDIIYRAGLASGLSASQTNVNDIAGNLKIKRIGPQLITIGFSDAQEDRAVALAKNLTEESMKKLESLNEKGDRYLSLSTLEIKPFVEKKELNPKVAGLVGFTLASFLGSVFLSVLEFSRGLSGRQG